MFAVIYRFKLMPHQESEYVKSWDVVVDYFKKERGAIGSCLHKSADDLWVAYSQWPDKSTRDAAWPKDGVSHDDFPEEIKEAIDTMHKIKNQNKNLEQFDEICLDIIVDKL